MKTQKIISASIAAVLTLGLAACSKPDVPSENDPGNVSSSENTKVPSKDKTTPTAPSVEPDADGERPTEDVPIRYDGPALDTVFAPEQIANLEKDADAIVYLLWGGLYDLTHARGENGMAAALTPLEDSLTESAYQSIVDVMNGTGDSALPFVMAKKDGTLPFGDQVLTTEGIDGVVSYSSISGASIALPEDGSEGVIYVRDIRAWVTSNEGQYTWDTRLTYRLVPNADNRWVLDGWNTEILTDPVKYEGE